MVSLFKCESGQSQLFVPLLKLELIYPQGDLNPCLMAENHVSWAWLDDGGVNHFSFTKIIE